MKEKKENTNFFVIVIMKGINVMSNKLYDLKLDWTFKNMFLNKSSFNYICYLFSILLDLNYYELMCYMKIINSELPSGVISIKSSYSDNN